MSGRFATLRNVRVSLRLRLSLIYGSMFFGTGALLVGVIYLLTAGSVNAKFQFIPPHGAQATLISPNQVSVGETDLARQMAAQRQAVLDKLVQTSLLTMVVLGVLTIALGYLVAGRTLRPLHKVTATAQRLSESTLHERIGLTGPRDEVKELADTFDGMLNRLHRAFDSQRRFIANASHELRTPLAINRTIIEVALAKPDAPESTRTLGHKLLGATARHERLIEGLLLLARSERELESRTPLDLRDLAAGAIEQFAVAAQAAGVRIRHARASAPTAGDAVLLERSVINLLENAIKYNVPDGQIWVSTGQTAGRAYVRVDNTGPIVSAEEVERIFEPFHRLRRDRVGSAQGAGLGLSIVQAVVHAHDGTILALPRPEGGLSITLHLPLVHRARLDSRGLAKSDRHPNPNGAKALR